MSLVPLSATPVLLGLLAAITWGAADFAGGLATRRLSASRVVFIAHGLSLLLLGAISLQMPVHLPPAALSEALLSGVAGAAGLMMFYQALSLGAMGLSAALSGLLTAVLPVVLALRTQGAPAPLQVCGFLVAAAAITLIAYAPAAPGASPARRTLLLATLAGACFGLQLVCLHAAAAAGDGSRFAPVVRALLLSRVGGASAALVVLLATRGRSRSREIASSPRSLILLAALAGLLDAGGNLFYMVSSLSGRLDVAAVLSSLYPGSTIVLAAIFLRERATRLQALGMGLALVAVALIAA
jgi:drug/metabolite transporter (DMT)-like permease